MTFSIGSHKIKTEVLILIVVVVLLAFPLYYSVPLMEGLDGITNPKTKPKNMVPALNKPVVPVFTTPGVPTPKEGFVGSNNTAYGPEFQNSKAPGYILNPSKWAMPTLSYSPGTTPSTGVTDIWNRPNQPIPLPKNELDIFATTKFKPECCPNTYSTSTGCACMTVGQYNYIKGRGGNNVPYSEY